MKLQGWRGPLFGAALGLCLVLTATSLAAPIRGSLRAPQTQPAEQDDTQTFYWKAWNGFVDPRPARLDVQREIAVVLTGDGADPIGCSYLLSGGDFLPRTIVTKAGVTLRVENRDGCSHELQSDDIPDFAPLATNPGNARAIAVPAGGPYTITDRLYGHVRGTVVTIPDLVACASVRSDGSFGFDGVPPGEYTLKVFQGARVVRESPVVVTDRELTLDPIALGGE